MRSAGVLTPQATTPSGGMQLFFAATKPYKNPVAIGGTGIDTRTVGGYVVLPLPRQWPRMAAPTHWRGRRSLPAPAWLDIALRQAPSPERR